MQIQAGLGSVFRIIQYAGDRRCSAFFRGAGGLHGIGEQAVANIAGRRIHLESGAHRLGARGIVAHQVHEALCNGLAGAAVDKFLLDAAQLWEFGKDAFSAERGDQVRGVTDGGVSGNSRKTIGASTLQAEA